MAELVLGIGTSHGPMLNTPPEQWGARRPADEANPALIFRGEAYTYPELAQMRGNAFADQCRDEVWQAKHAACRAGIAALGALVDDARLDALVVVSSDHKEVFGDDLLPQFAVYWGESIDHVPYTREQLDSMGPGLAVAEVANQPDTPTVRRGHPELALQLVRHTSRAGFDPAASQRLPGGKWNNHGIPHGWGFVFQQVLGGGADLLPMVPVFVNTFYSPNPPSAARCLDFGAALGDAIARFPSELRVGLVASGGLSHMVIDEELDRATLDAFAAGDHEPLRDLPDAVLRSGSSEIRNWLVVAEAMRSTGAAATVLDYQPCYRSPAGTGCGMAFAAWEPGRTDDAREPA
ncbi:hypothetical protein [Jiangella muralis]|uniref:DODA-type extradiol aromatic ring-opening family dioxygenase n=1 Tax=Jiangella muralis TaxID=702383 RepID=UPI00069D0F50|nr:hypothetical protein [Jiangella muralis]